MRLHQSQSIDKYHQIDTITTVLSARGETKTRILIITSVTTGSGHKSVSDSLVEQFNLMPDVEVKAIDGFDLAGRHAYHSSYIYGILTRHAPWLYNLCWKISDAGQPAFVVPRLLCSRRFLECVKDYEPDLIISVHSLFNSLITKLLHKYHLDIPVVVVQADLVSIHSTWCNKDAFMTICPTEQAREKSIRHGMDPDKLKVLRFPVRKRFVDAAMSSEKQVYDSSRPLRILLTGGGEGSIGIKKYARKILADPNVVLTIICGRNKKLQAKLQKGLEPEYKERVNILGFVDDMEQKMLQSDLLIARGSPNTLTEAVILGVPIIMTGPFLEQERGNFTIANDLNLGVVCNSPDDILSIISDLIANDAEGLKKMHEAQVNYRRFDNAYNIASYVKELTDGQN